MRLLKFVEQGGPRVAVVKQPGQLPKVGKGWVAAGEIDIDAGDGPRIGANSAEIVAAVEQDGYFMLPEVPNA